MFAGLLLPTLDAPIIVVAAARGLLERVRCHSTSTQRASQDAATRKLPESPPRSGRHAVVLYRSPRGFHQPTGPGNGIQEHGDSDPLGARTLHKPGPLLVLLMPLLVGHSHLRGIRPPLVEPRNTVGCSWVQPREYLRREGTFVRKLPELRK